MFAMLGTVFGGLFGGGGLTAAAWLAGAIALGGAGYEAVSWVGQANADHAAVAVLEAQLRTTAAIAVTNARAAEAARRQADNVATAKLAADATAAAAKAELEHVRETLGNAPTSNCAGSDADRALIDGLRRTN